MVSNSRSRIARRRVYDYIVDVCNFTDGENHRYIVRAGDSIGKVFYLLIDPNLAVDLDELSTVFADFIGVVYNDGYKQGYEHGARSDKDGPYADDE